MGRRSKGQLDLGVKSPNLHSLEGAGSRWGLGAGGGNAGRGSSRFFASLPKTAGTPEQGNILSLLSMAERTEL